MADDFLTLTGLRAVAHHGVYDHEKIEGQEFIVDLVVWFDSRASAASDDLTKTIHYGDLALEVVDALANDPVDLIETVAERIAAVALGYPAAERVRVTLHKPSAPITVAFDDVSITIERGRG